MAFTMLKRHRRLAAFLTLSAAIALTLLTLGAFGGRAPAAHAAVKHTVRHVAAARDPGTLQVGDQTSPDPAGNSQAGGPDTSNPTDPAGNSQAGGPDTGSTSDGSGVESELGQPGEPAVGHADPAGAAGSDCTGNCVQ